ncbi:MAG: peroxiredoxin family protein [Verrucomicrobiae bacterium]|nr:peroxiredoxin family protein [Verrucomicrobiae bacterium]
MPTAEQLVMTAMLLCGAGAVATSWGGRRARWAGRVNVAVTVASGLAAGWGAMAVLAMGPGESVQFLRMPRVGFALRLHVDGLSAEFLLLAAGISIPASVYSLRYLEHYRGDTGRYHPPFLVFLAAMYGLVSTTDMMWFFFIFWQLMTLPGYALIRYERNRPEHRRAAWRYLVMMQIACVITMAGAELVAGPGGGAAAGNGLRYDFGTVTAQLPELLRDRPGTTTLAFALFLAGFGIKMGMWPFGQVWLPDAHPAAPSPVSAMLSGVMIKTGVYGLVRYFFWLVPEEGREAFPLAAWGGWVTVLGTVTLLTGTVQALRQDATKRLLAFSSIGQVGYILLGVGMAMVLLPRGGKWAALGTFALAGALLHVWNHGVFKALHFLHAGSILRATGTQDLNRLGGLMRAMPWTGATALVATLAIAGVPPLNGFVSKWALYSAAFGAGREVWFLALCGMVALFTGALTLALFVKFFGVSFLGRSGPWSGPWVTTAADDGPSNGAGNGMSRRRPGLEASREVPGTMLGAQGALAALCVVLGLVPGIGLGAMAQAMRTSPGGYGPVLVSGMTGEGGWWRWEGPGGVSLLMPLAVVAMLGIGYGLASWVVRWGGAKRRQDAPWLCGYAVEADEHRYGARQFYGELKRWTRWAGGEAPRARDAGREEAP